MRLNFITFLGSGLRGGQKRWHWVVGPLFALLFANTLFLLARRYGFGCALNAYELCSVSVYYQANVLLHSLLGILLLLGLAGFVALHIPKNFKLALLRKKFLITGFAVLFTILLLFGSGIYFLFNAKRASVDWLYNTHLATAALIVLLYLGHRVIARPKQARAMITGGVSISFAVAALAVAIEMQVAPAAIVPTPTPKLAQPAGEYVQPTQVPPEKPFFPSPVSLASGADKTESMNLLAIPPSDVDKIRSEVEEQGFASSVLIGAEKCERCHADTVEQWASSAHRFSSFNNPFYVATVEYLRDSLAEPNEFVDQHLKKFGLPKEATGKVKSRWCAGCHDPLINLSGRMAKDIDKGSVEAQGGLICLSCHAIKEIPGHTGNGNYVWNDEFKDSYIFSGVAGGVGATLHDTYLKANPERHKADMLKPFYRKSEYCATCHKVALEKPVNDYRWLRGQNEYDNWHNSGVAHNAARTFYLPPKVRSCQDCHMPLVEVKKGDLAAKDGKIRSHRFEAANTALPFLRGDQKMLEATEKSLRDKALRLSVGGVAEAGGKIVALTDGKPHEITAADGHIELHAIVRNTGVGHTFPGGTNDSNEAWIEVTATGGGGTYSAGALDSEGHVIENTRIFNAVVVDRNGQRIEKRNAHEMVAPIYVAVIPPSTSDLSRYSIPLSQLGDLSQGAEVKVRLLWRKFNRTYSEFAYKANREGFGKFDAAPKLPITEIAAATVTLKREGERLLAQAKPPEGAKPGELLHDYAVGFLRQGDTRLARQVAELAIAADPASANYLRTKARVEIEEGQFPAARQTLTAAEKLAPADPQDAWLWAQVLVQEGDLSAADSAADQTLAAFPGDRMALKLKGRIAYLDGRFQDAVATINKVLEIDPEDATAHYYAMLAHRALGNAELEKTSEAAYKYHKADEEAQQATLALRQSDDDTNFAAQKIKTFVLLANQAAGREAQAHP
jgi:tetratricopeptide (TPR) repeat protein